MPKNLFIAGIDPGTTTAYAIIDVQGKFINARSRKEFSLSQLLREIHSQGKVIAIGTDKANIPGLIQEFSSKIGARVFAPREDLKVLEKKDIAGVFLVNDSHEMDALASALFARQQLSPLLSKIERFCEEYQKQQIKHLIIEKVISEGISINEAARMIEAPKEKVMEVKEEKPIQTLSQKTMRKREVSLKDLEEQLRILKRYNRLLKSQLEEKNRPKLIIRKDQSKEIQHKDQLISHLRKTIEKKEQDKQAIQTKSQILEHFLLRSKDHYVLKKLENLGAEEFKRKSYLSIQQDDFLLVDDPNTMSMAVIDDLRKIVSVIIHRKPISERVRTMLPFIFIDTKNLALKETNALAIVNKKELDEKRSARNALRKVIEDYKSERGLLNSS